MKKITSKLIVLSSLIQVALVSFVYAESGNSMIKLQNPLKNVSSLGQLVEKGVEIFTYIVVMGAVVAFIVVGLQFILARGNSEKMKEASKWLGRIVIGVAIVLGARVMINIIINTLSATGTVDPSVIQSAKDAVNSNK